MLSQKLPYCNYEWINDIKMDDLLNEIKNLNEDDDIGYILEVDLE